jgi:hypothetical protein
MDTTESIGQSADHRDNLGRFVPGNPGRQRGSKNKLREKVKGFVTTNIEGLQTWFDGLDPEKKIKVLNDLLPFCISKLQSVSSTDAEGNDVEPSVSIDWTKLSEKSLKEILTLTKIENGNHE